nr:uncharacterized protein LOC123839635 [Mirounga angustirostris]
MTQETLLSFLFAFPKSGNFHHVIGGSIPSVAFPADPPFQPSHQSSGGNLRCKQKHPPRWAELSSCPARVKPGSHQLLLPLFWVPDNREDLGGGEQCSGAHLEECGSKQPHGSSWDMPLTRNLEISSLSNIFTQVPGLGVNNASKMLRWNFQAVTSNSCRTVFMEMLMMTLTRVWGQEESGQLKSMRRYLSGAAQSVMSREEGDKERQDPLLNF